MTARERSLRWFVIGSAGFAAWRLLTVTAYLIFGPPIGPEYHLTQIFFYLSKGFLGGLFWPISLLIEGWRDPIAWVFYPW